MSFSADLKTELCSLETSACCKKAEALGMLLFGRAFGASEISLMTELQCVAMRYGDFIRELTGVVPVIKCSKAGNYKVYIDKKEDRLKVISFFGYTGSEVSLRVNHANFENASQDENGDTDDICCFKAFIRGAFSVCGSITDPEKDYHLEFTTPKAKLAADLSKIINETDLSVKTVIRSNSNVLYCKEAESIEMFIGVMGAGNTFVRMMQTRAMKELINRTNRRTNFETANLGRTIMAGMRQTELIEKILTKIKLTDMTEDLAQICTLRLDNPEASLDEIGKLASPPLSRSAVGRRFKKLDEIARELGLE